MTFYIEKIKAMLVEKQSQLDKSLKAVESEEFAQKHGELKYAAGCGMMTSQAFGAKIGIEYCLALLDFAYQKAEVAERICTVAQRFGIDEGNLADLEEVIAQGDDRDLRERIWEAAGEAGRAKKDRERDNTEEILKAAGFQFVQTDEFEGFERTTPGTGASQERSGKVERVIIEWNRNKDVYGFDYELNGKCEVSGVSGEFGKLLEAVGIAQNVEQPKC